MSTLTHPYLYLRLMAALALAFILGAISGIPETLADWIWLIILATVNGAIGWIILIYRKPSGGKI